MTEKEPDNTHNEPLDKLLYNVKRDMFSVVESIQNLMTAVRAEKTNVRLHKGWIQLTTDGGITWNNRIEVVEVD